jgi:hypothetical protein
MTGGALNITFPAVVGIVMFGFMFVALILETIFEGK